MKVYYFLGRLLGPVVTAALYLYSLLTGTPRARVVVRSEDGDILLLRTWPSSGTWSLPGGGLKRGERTEEAAARELREETGIDLPAESMTLRLTLHTQGHDELVYVATASKDRLPDAPPHRFEVRQMAWFSPDELPKVTPAVRRILAEVAAGG